MIYLLTPTGGRPEALQLLAEYINAQTYRGKLIWIVVDDCDPVTPVPQMREGIDVQVIRPDWRWQQGENTQAKSLLTGLNIIPDDATVFIFEDDDVYLPRHMETMLVALDKAQLVGEAVARYYNVATGRHRTLTSTNHSSLAATAFKGSALILMRAVCASRSKTIDMTLWRTAHCSKQLLQTGNVIGIKGMPGRGGIGIGHRDSFGTPDTGNILVDWIGSHAYKYAQFYKGDE